MRLPPRPRLTWKDDGTPVDERVGDVYYSVEDGLAESRAVFLAGCGMPEVWHADADQRRAAYTIAELGFGTGLNFLAAWQMWRRQGPAHGWLHFVSFEGYPLDRDEARRALAPWPELAVLADRLCAKWPVRATGVQQLSWPEDRVTLTLHTGLIEDSLPRSDLTADAWFLDGFSPAKNNAMWAETLWPLIAERAHHGTRAATFTVAGTVRRGLAEAGFEVEKHPGHGRKRERLEARYIGGSPAMSDPLLPPRAAPRIAVIGAGISGACLAYALQQRGAAVRVFDQSSGPAQGTSGNPLALVMPRLDAADTVQARLLLDAYLSAQDFYADLPGAAFTETTHRPRDEAEATRFEKVLADPPLGLEQLEALRGGGLLHKRSLLLRPAELLPALLHDIDVSWGGAVDLDLDALSANGRRFDAIVLAGGWQMAASLPELDLTRRLGQVEYYQSETAAPPSALAAGPYALAIGETRLWGATFGDQTGPAPRISAAAQAENISALARLDPYWRGEASRAKLVSRAGVRATTADRLPLIGPLPDKAAMMAARQSLERSGWTLAADGFARAGIFVASGYGSRGFTWAPWAARILTATLFGDPSPVTKETRRAIAPNRQILRPLKRGTL
ncbi:MAG: FAD-dependent 5-carboxymethylaminomethyl-2-thiouridine(34) oxidoreductase MnmC [Pseudomonadota bacterium]